MPAPAAVVLEAAKLLGTAGTPSAVGPPTPAATAAVGAPCSVEMDSRGHQADRRHLEGLAARLEKQFPAPSAGTAVTWCAALKPPGCRRLLVLDGCKGSSGGSTCSWEDEDVDEWVQSRLLGKGWTGWIAYNDAPPPFKPGSKFGHCKGILAWSKDRLGWLVHSVPDWPAAFSNSAVSPLVNAGVKNGQSFVFLLMARTPELTKQICGNVVMMNPAVFLCQVSTEDEKQVWPFGEARFTTSLPVPPSQPPSLVQLGPGVWHLAKHGEWSRTRYGGRPTHLDFYEDALAQTEPFTGTWHVQSWRLGKADVDTFGCTDSVDNIVQILLPDYPAHRTTKDHGKWGVHRDRPLVVIGDLNRTSDQTKRGGGGVVIEAPGLWRALTSVVSGLESSSGLVLQEEQRPHWAAGAGVRPDGATHIVGFGGSGRGGSVLSSLVGRTPGGTLGDGAGRGRRAMSTAAAGSGSSGSVATDSLDGDSTAAAAAGEVESGTGRAGAAAGGISKGCGCSPENCGKFKCSCKGHACTERCKCRGQCGLSLQAAAAAAAGTAAGEEAGGEGAAQPQLAAGAQVAGGAAALQPAAAAAAAAPAPAAAAAEAPATPEPPPLEAIAAALPNLMKAAAAAAAVSSAAPAARLLEAQTASRAAAAPAASQAAAAPAAAQAAVGAGPGVEEGLATQAGMAGTGARKSAAGGSSKRCGCSPENCGKFKCSCKGHVCTERCKCRGQCGHSLQAAAAAAAGTAAGEGPKQGMAAADDKQQQLQQQQQLAKAAEAAATAGPDQSAGQTMAAAAPPAEVAADAAAPAEPSPPAPGPMSAPVAAMGAAFQRFMQATAAAVTAAASHIALPGAPGGPPAGGNGAVESGTVAAAAASPPTGSNGTAGSRGQLKAAGGTAGGDEGCCCAKGCQDKRCSCRKAGMVCGPHCAYAGCTNRSSP